MNISTNILLPGLEKQFEFLRKNLAAKMESVLVIGSASEYLTKLFVKHFSGNVDLIVEDYESLLNSKIVLGDNSKIKISLMEYDVTDFNNASFDLAYAQASISLTKRNKIVKEIKRILKPGGLLCVGEIVSLTKDVPGFVRDVFLSSDLMPLYIEELDKYYEEKSFKIITRKDLSDTLKDYYSTNVALLKDNKDNLTNQEKSYYKKILGKISHESNVYLKLGGDKYIGFVSLILKKGEI